MSDIAEANADLDSLIAIVAEGKSVRIEQEGEPVAELVPARKRPIDLAKLRVLSESMQIRGEGPATSLAACATRIAID